MNIAPPHVKPYALPSLEVTRQVRDRQEQAESFGEVLAAALRTPSGSRAPGIERQSPSHDGAHAPAANDRPSPEDGMPVAIGEDAVRFDARPIVGPSLASLAPARVKVPGPVGAVPSAPASMELPMLGSCLQSVIALAARRVEALDFGPITDPARASAPSRTTTGAVKESAAGSVEGLAPISANRGSAQPASAAPADVPDGAKAEMGTNVSLTLLADEVLVTVRGLDLSADEEDMLGDEMRRLLASSNLSGRTVRVVTSRRT